MDRETFVRKQVKRGGWASVEEFLEHLAVEPCACGKKKCKGWQVRWKFGAERRSGEVRKLATTPATVAGFVYFAQLGELIKIGFSQTPEERAHRLNATLLGTLRADREFERALHEEFDDLWERNEWFRVDPRLLERIKALTA